MGCFRPRTAFLPLGGGPIVFREMKDTREIRIPCGYCVGCRTAKRSSWALRCLLESKMHERNAFITLTYDDDHYPAKGSLYYRDVQLFMKRLRNFTGPFRFFVAGEYGEDNFRPHWHLLMFGHNLNDLTTHRSVFSRYGVYSSDTLSKAWPHGFHSVGELNRTTATYTCSYIDKKFVGPNSDDHYTRVDWRTGELTTVEPEFARMSLRPGIGRPWLEKWYRDIYLTGHDGIYVDGRKVPVPKYFNDLLKDGRVGPEIDYDGVEYKRYLAALENSKDYTLDRLAVREQVAIARAAFYRGMYNQGNLQ